MKTGVICDGISRDLDHALTVMSEFDLEYAELQFVWDKEVGDHSPDEIAKIKELLKSHNKPVSCLSRHIFAGMTKFFELTGYIMLRGSSHADLRIFGVDATKNNQVVGMFFYQRPAIYFSPCYLMEI